MWSNFLRLFFTPSQPHAQFSSTTLHDGKGSSKHSGKHPNNVADEVKIFSFTLSHLPRNKNNDHLDLHIRNTSGPKSFFIYLQSCKLQMKELLVWWCCWWHLNEQCLAGGGTLVMSFHLLRSEHFTGFRGTAVMGGKWKKSLQSLSNCTVNL